MLELPCTDAHLWAKILHNYTHNVDDPEAEDIENLHDDDGTFLDDNLTFNSELNSNTDTVVQYDEDIDHGDDSTLQPADLMASILTPFTMSGLQQPGLADNLGFSLGDILEGHSGRGKCHKTVNVLYQDFTMH